MPSADNSSDSKYKTYANIGFLSVVVIGVWVLFLLPVILFSTQPVENVSIV